MPDAQAAPVDSPTGSDRHQPLSLQLDGRPHTAPVGSTLAALVASLGHGPADVATALNGDFVPRSEREARRLADGDAVLLFQAITGG